MSVLKTLKLSAAAPAASANDPLSRAREKLLGQLAEQKDMVGAALEGRLYEPPKVPAIRKDASGQRVRVEVARRVRKGWFQDEAGTVHAPIGKVSFGIEALETNFTAFMDQIVRSKPAAAKGVYVRNVSVSSTMGPGVTIDSTLYRV